MESKIALIFPAFVTEFNGKEIETLKACGGSLDELLQQASVHTNLPLQEFDLENNNFLDDELKTQYITYIFSCAFAGMLKERNIIADHNAGYSMGIYAALYNAGSVSFITGLDLITSAYYCIQKSLAKGEYAMGITGGLEEKDVHELLLIYAPHVSIININSPYSFVFSGARKEIIHLIDAAREEGALQARVMNVTLPYHSPFLDGASHCFKMEIDAMELSSPEKTLISSIDQRQIRRTEDVKNEVVRNIHTPFCWYKTILSLGVNSDTVFIECGAGESLTKLNRFIRSGMKTYNLKNIRQYIGDR